jgi:hypothetical protein
MKCPLPTGATRGGATAERIRRRSAFQQRRKLALLRLFVSPPPPGGDARFRGRQSAVAKASTARSTQGFWPRRAPLFTIARAKEKNMSEPLNDRFVDDVSSITRAESCIANRSVRLSCPALVGMALALLVASGCGGGPADKLEGKWVGERIDNVSAEQVAKATAWVKATTLEFAGDKLTVTIPTETARKGTFKVAKVEGDKVVLSVHRKDSPTRDETTFTLQGDKTLRWDIGQSREITLVRAQ